VLDGMVFFFRIKNETGKPKIETTQKIYMLQKSKNKLIDKKYIIK